MKKILFVIAIATMVLGMSTASAFALHTGYDATTGNCRSCHAVHNATGDSLYTGVTQSRVSPMMSTVYNSWKSTTQGGVAFSATGGATLQANAIATDLCAYCHVYGQTDPVYQKGMTRTAFDGYYTSEFLMGMHSLDATITPDKGTASSVVGKLDCVECHNAMPHAAKWNENVAFYVQDAGTTEAEVVNNMCQRCHEANSQAHALEGKTHPLVETPSTNFATTGYGPQTIAWSDSKDCLSCHNNAVGGLDSLHQLSTPIAGNAYKLNSGGTDIVAGATISYIASNATGWKFTNFGISGQRGYSTNNTGANADPALTTWAPKTSMGYAAVIPKNQVGFTPTFSKSSLKVQDTQCMACHRNADSSQGVGVTW